LANYLEHPQQTLGIQLLLLVKRTKTLGTAVLIQGKRSLGNLSVDIGVELGQANNTRGGQNREVLSFCSGSTNQDSHEVISEVNDPVHWKTTLTLQLQRILPDCKKHQKATSQVPTGKDP
jgi:hypothetical protein